MAKQQIDRPTGPKYKDWTPVVGAGAVADILMFFEGAPRLLDAGVTIPGLQKGDPGRIVVEAYPGVLARGIMGRRSYKQDRRRSRRWNSTKPGSTC